MLALIARICRKISAKHACSGGSLIIIVMGVSGSGKSTVGRALADRLGVPFFEGDDFHSEANVQKMSAGIALTDVDRVPWVAVMASALNAHARSGGAAGTEDMVGVLACSALTRFVRAELRAQLQPPCSFVHLAADRQTIQARLDTRAGHFMKSTLCDSQFAALQEPEDALRVRADRPVSEIVEQLLRQLRSHKK